MRFDSTVQTSENRTPANSGMTTKVAKGSLWTLGGQILPLALALLATPFTIRFLGSESYGVLILIGLISTYLSDVDLGMAVSSTKFASGAFGEGDREREKRIVWTAASISAASALVVALPTFFFSGWIVAAFNVPDKLLYEASIAVKLTSISSVLIVLSLVLNSPMLARLRMDLNTVTQALPKGLLVAGTPFVLYFGGGIVGAVLWVLVISIATIIAVLYFSGRLLPELFRPSIDRAVFFPLMKYGGAWFIAVIAGIIIGNLEKFLLTSLVSVRSLAYYSIAFTLANAATLFSHAMLQSLLPAFSQMMSLDRRAELNSLFSRGARLVIVALIPIVIFLFVIGKPFLTIWAGEEFGRESTLPFYILLSGFSLSIFSVLPYSVLFAAGRTDYFAKMYWIELPFYAMLAWFLIGRFEIVGAAVAFALRTIFTGIWAIYLCNRSVQLRYELRSAMLPLIVGTGILLPVAIFAAFDNFTLWLIPVALFSFGLYGFHAWKQLLDASEKLWLTLKIRTMTGFIYRRSYE